MLEVFRKVSEAFSLVHCDYPSMLGTSAALLRSLSLNLDPRHEEEIPTITKILDVTATASYLYVYLVSMVWFVFGRCIDSGDVLVGLIVFSLGISSEIGPLKLLFMFLNKNKLRSLVAQCLASDSLIEPGSRLYTNLMKTLRVVKMRAIVFWSVLVGNGFVYLMKAVLLPGRHLMEDFFVFYGLEPMFETPNFQIAFLLNTIAIGFTIYLPSNTVVFQIITSGYIEAQMLAWSEELLYLWQDAKKHYFEHKTKPKDIQLEDGNDEQNIVNEFVSRRLKTIIKAHAKSIELYKMMDEIFSSAIVVEILTLIISLIAELLGGLENTYMEVPFALMQVGADCFIGQRLIDASMVYNGAVYNCKWEYFDKKNMKMVTTMMVISNKTMCLTAGSVMKLNFVSFLGIVKNIYSMYTTLRATMH